MSTIIPVKLVMTPQEYTNSGMMDYNLNNYRVDMAPGRVVVTLCKHVNTEHSSLHDDYTDMAAVHCSDCGSFLGYEN